MDLSALENQRRADRCEFNIAQLCQRHWLMYDTGLKGIKIGEGTFANVYKGKLKAKSQSWN